MDAMRQHHVTARNSKRIKIGDIAHAGFLLDHLAFAFVFRRVGVNHYPAFARPLGDFSEQLSCATHRKPRCKATTNPTIRLTMPFIN